MKRALLLFCIFILMVSGVASASAGDAKVHRRALLVGRTSAVRGPILWGGSALPSVRYELNGVKRAMEKNNFDGNKINISLSLNRTKAEVRASIKRKFQNATDFDVSYLYLSGHGVFANGEYYVQPCLGAPISATELRAWLSPVPGRIVLVVNACQSGALIGKSASRENANYARGFASAFAFKDTRAKADFGEKFLVMCSARGSESAYTLKKEDLFGWSYAAGMGYDYVGRENSYLADEDGDWQITQTELYRFAKANVLALCVEFGILETQTVCALPEADDFVLYAK